MKTLTPGYRKTAYQSAKEAGYTGTEKEWWDMLASGPWLKQQYVWDGPLAKNGLIGLMAALLAPPVVLTDSGDLNDYAALDGVGWVLVEENSQVANRPTTDFAGSVWTFIPLATRSGYYTIQFAVSEYAGFYYRQYTSPNWGAWMKISSIMAASDEPAEGPETMSTGRKTGGGVTLLHDFLASERRWAA